MRRAAGRARRAASQAAKQNQILQNENAALNAQVEELKARLAAKGSPEGVRARSDSPASYADFEKANVLAAMALPVQSISCFFV